MHNTAKKPILEIRDLGVKARKTRILSGVNMRLHQDEVLGIVGPSGAGKSTLLRAINRLLELQPGYSVSGSILLHGEEILSSSVDPDSLRERIGMIFQQPTIFPASIAENVLFGAKRLRKLPRSERAALVESSLRSAALWDEVKDRLKDSARRLSIGQQQRLCLARTIATDPEIVLMDEPTSALDPKASEAVETGILSMKSSRSVIIVTHNLDQARRLTDWVACLCTDNGHGEVLESACCDAFFSSETCQRVFSNLESTPATLPTNIPALTKFSPE
ncbi:MAG: phosphate ABC transporter ATP-binding protein [Luteolibacter sp.]